MANEPPRWKPRRWGDPSTVAAFLMLLLALVLILLDGLDEVLWGKPISFGGWPYLLLTGAAVWFFGYVLPRMGGGNGD